MKKQSIKIFLAFILIFNMTFILIGCSKQKTINIRIDGIGKYKVLKMSDQVEKAINKDDGSKVTLNKDGNYQWNKR